MSGYILGLEEQRAGELELAGGKGAGLARLLALGDVSVPEGFVVTAPCYRETAAADPRTAALLEQLERAGEEEDRIRLGAALRDRIGRLSLPGPVWEELRRRLEAWGEETAWAVRSSATAEDLPGASFAGQQDTFLNVRGAEAVGRAVTRCWASLFNDRAVAYRREQGFSSREAAIAVVVQRMADARVSGVLFTADPMTSDRRTLVVEAVEGLGEKLVSGRSTPFSWRLRDGVLRAEGPGEPPLAEGEVRRLAALGRRVERAFGREQDIEWCWDGERFQLVQARPITPSFPVPPARRASTTAPYRWAISR